MKSTSAYDIIHFVASHHWNPTATFHTVCYRAHTEMQTSREQNKILDDLHWRMTCQRWSNASVDDIVGFWYSLLDYRVNVLSERPWRCTEDRCTEDVALTTTEVAQAIHKWEVISYGMRHLQDNGDTMPTKKRASSEICYTKKLRGATLPWLS